MARVKTPDAELQVAFEAKRKAHPNYMEYFILQVLGVRTV